MGKYVLYFTNFMHLHLTNLLNFSEVVVDSFEFHQDAICFKLSILAKGMNCPHCSRYTEELHQNRPILVRDLSAFGKDVYLQIPRRQFYCRLCQRYITEKLEFVDTRRKYTHRYAASIYAQVNNFSVEAVSQEQGLSVEEVKKIFKYVQQRLNQVSSSQQCR